MHMSRMESETPGKVLRGCFGYSNSGLAFGHNGAGGQAAWGDPVTGISFVFLTNTFAEPRKMRVVEVSSPKHDTLLLKTDGIFT